MYMNLPIKLPNVVNVGHIGRGRTRHTYARVIKPYVRKEYLPQTLLQGEDVLCGQRVRRAINTPCAEPTLGRLSIYTDSRPVLRYVYIYIEDHPASRLK